VLTLSIGAYALALVERAPLPDQIFECASALGTVGLSRGITGSLSPAGKIIIVALMFLGRLGPVAFGMAFFREPSDSDNSGEEDVAI
jgi:trk system potassium uptake protein TrkH